MDESVFVHIVTYNDEETIQRTIDGVVGQVGIQCSIYVTDNNSSDGTLDALAGREELTVKRNVQNLGFCAAHNQGVKRFLDGNWRYLLVLNPDIFLEEQCIQNLVRSVNTSEKIGLVTPKLFRADASLNPIDPARLDAAGMELTSALRHFDRGSDLPDTFHTEEEVFGGTGACLLLERSCIEDLLLRGEGKDSTKYAVYPELKETEEERAPLFDEGFFAYREDADLSWRARLLGWRCRFVPQAIGYHKRVVLSTNREKLSARLNGLGVQNRFLLQLNNYFPEKNSLWMFLYGFLLRNIIVIAGVLLREHTSLVYLANVTKLGPRALERRRIIKGRCRV